MDLRQALACSHVCGENVFIGERYGSRRRFGFCSRGETVWVMPYNGPVRLPFLLSVVLYGQRFENTVTCKALMAATRNWDEHARIPVAIWDNSSDAIAPDVPLPLELVDWTHQPANTGLVEAYNASVELAKNSGFEWILLLDQDTNLTEHFLNLAAETASSASAEVAAIAPKILVNAVQRSPNGHILECPIGSMVCKKPGVSDSLIFAINSGMLVRTEFVDAIGGYSNDYRLDAVDHWFCREVYRHGKKIAVLPVEFEHGLSVYDKQKFVSIDRFASIMQAQTTFALSSARWSSKLLYALMLLAHCISQTIRRPGKPYAGMALQEWFRFLKRWSTGR